MLVLQDYIHLQVVNVAINVLLRSGPSFPSQARQNAEHWPDGWHTSDGDGDIALQSAKIVNVVSVVVQVDSRSPDKEIDNCI